MQKRPSDSEYKVSENHIYSLRRGAVFFAFLVKLFCLITNILFGILTGVIKLYYICSYIKDRKARNGNTLHWPMSWWSLRGVFYTNKNVTICSLYKQLYQIKKSCIIYVVAAVALQAQALVLDTIYDTKYNIDKE